MTEGGFPTGDTKTSNFKISVKLIVFKIVIVIDYTVTEYPVFFPGEEYKIHCIPLMSDMAM